MLLSKIIDCLSFVSSLLISYQLFIAIRTLSTALTRGARREEFGQFYILMRGDFYPEIKQLFNKVLAFIWPEYNSFRAMSVVKKTEFNAEGVSRVLRFGEI